MQPQFEYVKLFDEFRHKEHNFNKNLNTDEKNTVECLKEMRYIHGLILVQQYYIKKNIMESKNITKDDFENISLMKTMSNSIQHKIEECEKKFQNTFNINLNNENNYESNYDIYLQNYDNTQIYEMEPDKNTNIDSEQVNNNISTIEHIFDEAIKKIDDINQNQNFLIVNFHGNGWCKPSTKFYKEWNMFVNKYENKLNELNVKLMDISCIDEQIKNKFIEHGITTLPTVIVYNLENNKKIKMEDLKLQTTFDGLETLYNIIESKNI